MSQDEITPELTIGQTVWFDYDIDEGFTIECVLESVIDQAERVMDGKLSKDKYLAYKKFMWKGAPGVVTAVRERKLLGTLLPFKFYEIKVGKVILDSLFTSDDLRITENF